MPSKTADSKEDEAIGDNSNDEESTNDDDDDDSENEDLFPSLHEEEVMPHLTDTSNDEESEESEYDDDEIESDDGDDDQWKNKFLASQAKLKAAENRIKDLLDVVNNLRQELDQAKLDRKGLLAMFGPGELTVRAVCPCKVQSLRICLCRRKTWKLWHDESTHCGIWKNTLILSIFLHLMKK